MIHLRNEPLGIDKQIQRMQTVIHNDLNFDNFDAYSRVELIREKEAFVPYIYLDGIEYKEVLFDDSKKGQFFFVEEEITRVDGNLATTFLSIVFQMDLNAIYTDTNSRKDERARIDIYNALKKCAAFKIIEIVRGENALKGFKHDLINMQPYHFLKFYGTIKYQINC